MGISKEYVFPTARDFRPTKFSRQANILVDQTGCARLADFGLLTIISDPTNSSSSISLTQAGTTRWMSPELIDPQRFGLEKSRPTEASDCYALGMVIYETISGRLPFHNSVNWTVFVKVLGGERPDRDRCFTDSLWETLESCWKAQPDDRLSAQGVLQRLQMELSSPWLDVEVEEDGDGQDSSGDSFCTFPRFIPSAESHGPRSRVDAGVPLAVVECRTLGHSGATSR